MLVAIIPRVRAALQLFVAKIHYDDQNLLDQVMISVSDFKLVWFRSQALRSTLSPDNHGLSQFFDNVIMRV